MPTPIMTGWAHSRFGKSSATLNELIAQVAVTATEDAGLAPEDLDAIHVGVYNNGLQKQGFEAALLGVEAPEFASIPAHRHESACATGSAAVFAAYDSVASGRNRAVLVIGAEKMTEAEPAVVNEALLGASWREEEEHFGSFAGVFAEVVRRYEQEYGDPSRAMAEIAAKNHAYGALNPLAHMQKDLGIEFCDTVSERNPIVAGKLRRTDCSLVSDGAAALVISSDKAAESGSKAVAWRGMGSANEALPISARDPLKLKGAGRAMHNALQQARVNIYDLSLLETHDCFTIAELLQYEAFGLTEPGRGASALASGITTAEGSLPVNPSGGLKAKGHPIGATGVSMHVTAAMQLTGTFPGMQIAGAELAGVFNMGGLAVSNFASILEVAR